MNQYHCRLTNHGRRHLELGVVYPLSRGQRHSVYRVDAYFFTPFHLGLNERRYGVGPFFSDLSSYVRYAPASLPLAKMTDPACELSPLVRIAGMLDRSSLQRELDAGRLLYEIRAFVNIFHGQLRETRRMVGEKIRQSAADEDLLTAITALLKDMDACLRHFRELGIRFLNPAIPETLRVAMAWADESISLKTEKEIHKIYRWVAQRAGLVACAEALKPILAREQCYRQRQNYQTVIDPARPETGEVFLYRESMLKKWAQAALYMDFLPDKRGARVTHILAGVAAASAMAFAVAATFLADRLFASYSLPWVALIVLAYMFKDRIKELLRTCLITFVPKLVSDESKSLVDLQLRRKVGAMRARVRFCQPHHLPADVVRLRDLSGNPFNAIMPPENVIHYHSTVRLDSDALLRHHPRLEALTNILRLKLDSWLNNMDDPSDEVSFARDGDVEAIKANRVYHVSVILRLSGNERDDDARFFKYLVVLNRDGLVRIEGPIQGAEACAP